MAQKHFSPIDALAVDLETMFTELYTAIANLQAGAPVNGIIPFAATKKLVAASAATPVSIVTGVVGKKVYVTGFWLVVNGAAAWVDAGATKLVLRDTNGTPVTALEVAKAALTGNAVVNMATSGVSLATPLIRGSGLTVDKGLELVADAVFGAGDDVYVTVTGYLAA